MAYGSQIVYSRAVADPDRQPTTTAAFLWPDEERGPFRIYLEWSVVEGRQEVVGLTISSVPAEEGWKNPVEWLDAAPTPVVLTTDWLRRLTDGRALSFSRIVARTKQILAEEFLPKWESREPERRAELEQRADLLAQQPRPRTGRPPLPPSHFAEVAALYERAFWMGENPTQSVADQKQVSRSTAANWVSKARQLGFLGPTTRGRPGGVSDPYDLLHEFFVQEQARPDSPLYDAKRLPRTWSEYQDILHGLDDQWEEEE